MGKQPTRIVFDMGDKIRISPPLWLDNKLDVEPGDLSKFVPYGTTLYGFQPVRTGTPLVNAPKDEASGGLVYFDNDITLEDLQALMRVLGIQTRFIVNPSKDFAVFTAESDQPGKDGYLTQMRMVSKFALRSLYGAIKDEEVYRTFPGQGVTMVEAMWSFIQHERKRWGTSFTQDTTKGLEGLFGGDGEFMREQLSFGFMVENGYYGVCRIWSRAWLVCK